MRLFRSITGDSGSFGGWTSSKSRGGVGTKQPEVAVRAILDNGRRERVGSWTPPTFKIWYLGTLLILTCVLIAAVAWLHVQSARDQGIIFAKDVNELPLSRSFSYLYLPTIISVIYSFLWTWLDLDIKRLEPYFQLSKGEAKAGDSILLSYPLEFLATVPFLAFKRRQWAVFSGSIIMILVFWGLTPIQAGMFATRTIVLQEAVTPWQSLAYTPIEQQGNLTVDYAQSTYNIAWLNESLPPYMTKEYMLAPFGPAKEMSEDAINQTFTGQTVMYSIDISCETAILWEKSEDLWYYNSSEGCSYYPPSYRPNGGGDLEKPFDTLYAGYQNQNGFADYYLSPYCKTASPHTFFVRWSKSNTTTIKTADNNIGFYPGAANATSLYCVPTYYQQPVNATVSWPERTVLDVIRIGQKSDLPQNMFNVSTFEWAMSSGQAQFTIRGNYPTSGFPDQRSQLTQLPLNLEFVPKMAPFAIATYRRPLDDYLDPEHLRLSYQAAYRLLFARQLSDILLHDRTSSAQVGQQVYRTQAVVIVPGFAFAVIGILGTVLVLGTGLLIGLPRRKNMLHHDPATIGALMSLTSANDAMYQDFSGLDTRSEKGLAKALANSSFELRVTDNAFSTSEVTLYKAESDGNPPVAGPETSPESTGGIRPFEMKLVTGMIFLLLQIAALSTFLALFLKARSNNGLALPSQTTFVRQLLENYVPIALATLIEPFWLLLNRYLSILQPFEELRRDDAPASKSIDLDYSSLPPQFLFLRAMRARHFVMVLVCLMVLLANGLSVALSGLMYEGQQMVPTGADFMPTKAARFRALNGTGMPFNADGVEQTLQGGMTNGPFYRIMSNLTADTPLPPWTDSDYAYVPVDLNTVNENDTAEITTVAFAAELRCARVSSPNDYILDFYDPSGVAAALNVSLLKPDGSTVNCTDERKWTGSWIGNLRDPQDGHVAIELGTMLGSNASAEDHLYCRQHLLAGWLRVDWKTTSGEVRHGPGINYYGDRNMTMTSRNDTMLICTPNISANEVAIKVDGKGRVLESLRIGRAIPDVFSFSMADVQAQANYFLADLGGTWHKDAYPSDFLNYLIKESTNDSSLLDPNQPVPNPGHAAQQLSEVYRRLFAILVGTNLDLLLEDADPQTSAAIHGTIQKLETRILFSTPAFIVTECIFGLYIIVTIFFYARRPWKVLPRLPSSPASIVAYFAGCRALDEMGRRRFRTEKEAKEWRAGKKWAWKLFEGVDGNLRIGIDGWDRIDRRGEPPPYEVHHHT
ncbi:hypothetical protein CKM354_001060900 [Cercospora kikuchii]|uniref:Uncharacterized protein n=1 Tax=Cercospora kikuchii TaxID=84275 RepID=A0A9P3FKX9_9PEZI|nr:uncharacterized protein CKM354_001060900 [Cercospora kikuchii]GIZ47520.1 hypothetical protein CKM354_001060900 [Cercospora kikuchii]